LQREYRIPFLERVKQDTPKSTERHRSTRDHSMHPLRVELLRRVIPRFQRRQQVETTVTALRVVDHPSLTTTASSTSSLRSFRLLSHR
jgi:hypothetical protein